MIDIVLADDEGDWLEEIQDMLLMHSDCRIVASTTQTAHLITLLETHRPHILCLDMMMPGLNGLQISHMLKQRSKIPILMISAHLDRVSLEALQMAHIRGYVPKHRLKHELYPAIHSIVQGQTWFPDSLRLDFSQAEKTQKQQHKAWIHNLTLRERDICLLLLDGLGPKQIAIQLGLSSETVKSLLRQLRDKAGVSDTYQLIGILHRLPLRES